jgi:hypothetical protein
MSRTFVNRQKNPFKGKALVSPIKGHPEGRTQLLNLILAWGGYVIRVACLKNHESMLSRCG